MMIDTLNVRSDDSVHSVDNRLCNNSLVRGGILPAEAAIRQTPHQVLRLQALPGCRFDEPTNLGALQVLDKDVAGVGRNAAKDTCLPLGPERLPSVRADAQ